MAREDAGAVAVSPPPLRFECTQCGLCCTVRGDYAHVYVEEDECRRLAQGLGRTVARIKRRFTFVDQDGWRQLRFESGRCVFLRADGRCGVYEVRPRQCRTFPFWPELVGARGWTRRAHRLCEGLGRGSEVSSEEVRKRLELARSQDQDS